MSNLYPKIMSPFKRHIEGPLKNKLDWSQWSRPEFEALANLDWEWTEKIDGTNVRIVWDGYAVDFRGRTDAATLPLPLLAHLRDSFPEEILEQQFGATPVVLYGEGYGARIQKGGGNYRPDQAFILFDILIDGWWLMRPSVEDYAQKLGLGIVPFVFTAPVIRAIARVEAGSNSFFGDFLSEGLVGKPPLGLRGRDGDRLMMKVKTCDFYPATYTFLGSR